MSGWGAILALALVLASQVAMAQKRNAKAKPPRVVVLDFEGDRRGALRTQVEAALKKTKQVELVPLKRYTAAAGKAGVRGAEMRSSEGVASVAPGLKVDAVVTANATGRVLVVRMLGARGQELWTKDVKLQKGRMSASDARRLAAGLATTAVSPPPVVEPPPAEPATPPAEPTEPATRPPESAPPPVATAPSTPPPEATPAPAQTPPPEGTPTKPAEPPEAVATPKPSEPLVAPTPIDDESHTSTSAIDPYATRAELEAQDRHRYPPLFRLFLGGTTTWRMYCARPGVSSCAAFDSRPEEQQVGDTVDFESGVPYLGLVGQLELMPLGRMENKFLRGLGLGVGYVRGYSETRVKVTTETGETPTRTVVATDTMLMASLLYRYYFNMGTESTPRLGFAGLKGGMLGRAFDVDDEARAPLTGSHRLHPSVGLEFSVPLRRWLRIEGGGQFFLNPQAGQSLTEDKGALELEVRELGEQVSSAGWSAELGVAGDFWGPLGYSARFRYTNVKDTFTGRGSKFGWEQGGVAQENHADILWGLTVSY
ncbi:hypothetical protein [Hyalangium rubrum]|uniref:Outer membrane protein beta-barrel domain-containing protein n=1 Tax=Hyalangium rubrum TaxID=3103134 RepID=A0ABU5H5A3_9BACT|nr:hypothetical protein [Hyalangium sp. s54d21]MDY7227983.1 hypothetical protein [Hyalangium sp. s54d21]